MSPAEQLRAAAAKIRETRARLDSLSESLDLRGRFDLVNEWADCFGPDDIINYPEVNAWIALMSPAVAEPLAAWLYDASLEYERTLRDHGPDAATYAVYHAMPVARAILGEAP